MFSKRRRRNRFSNLFGGGLLLLSSLSLVSIGFSTWSIGSGNADGSIYLGADSITDYSSYVTIHTNPSFFKFAKSGLVVDDTIVYKASATFEYDVAIKDGLAKENGGLSQIGFDVELIDKGTFGLISATYMGSSPNIAIKSDFSSGTISNQTSSFITNGVKTSFTYNSSSLVAVNSIKYSLSYSFDFSSYKDSFETSIYNNIKDNDFSFLFRVGVSI